jgi:hypothetical protein
VPLLFSLLVLIKVDVLMCVLILQLSVQLLSQLVSLVTIELQCMQCYVCVINWKNYQVVYLSTKAVEGKNEYLLRELSLVETLLRLMILIEQYKREILWG